MDLIKTKAGHFVYKGHPLRLRGFGVGTWLCLEHFMMGLPTAEICLRRTFAGALGAEDANRFFTAYQAAFLDEEDFQIMKDHGVNFIRVPFNYRLFIDDDAPDAYREEGFALFDHLFALCRKYEIFAMPDLHAAPGAQNPDWHSDNDCGVPLFWRYGILRRQTAKLWGAIAARYKNEEYLMGYDLLNEPAMASWPALNEFYRDAIREIRAADPNHVIVLEGDCFSMDFSGLGHFDDENLAIGFHYYPTVWHPELMDKAMPRARRKAHIADGLDRILKQAEAFGWPVLCGEFGYGPPDCGGVDFAMELLADTLDLLEQRGTSWTLWCYKDAGFMGLAAPKENSGWMALVRDIGAEWNQDTEKRQAQQMLDVLAEKDFPQMTEDERYLLQFRLRAGLYMLQGSHVLAPRLKALGAEKLAATARDFEAERCMVQPQMSRLLKKVLNA